MDPKHVDLKLFRFTIKNLIIVLKGVTKAVELARESAETLNESIIVQFSKLSNVYVSIKNIERAINEVSVNLEENVFTDNDKQLIEKTKVSFVSVERKITEIVTRDLIEPLNTVKKQLDDFIDKKLEYHRVNNGIGNNKDKYKIKFMSNVRKGEIVQGLIEHVKTRQRKIMCLCELYKGEVTKLKAECKRLLKDHMGKKLSLKKMLESSQKAENQLFNQCHDLLIENKKLKDKLAKSDEIISNLTTGNATTMSGM